MNRSRMGFLAGLLLLLALCSITAVAAQRLIPTREDPLVHMPGTAPEQVSLIAPQYCLPCHGGYREKVEPVFNWRGSMMAQAGRDFIFWAALAVASQDTIWATGSRNGADLCTRCHLPKGWLEGRSDPANGSAMTGADFDGVQCDFCHRMVDPFFHLTYTGSREGDDWGGYWDEAEAERAAIAQMAAATYQADLALAQEFTRFDGDSFYVDNLPFSAGYVETGAGQYFVSPDSRKRASFADGDGNHRIYYSRYHKSKYFCATCHDVSNPILTNLGADPAQPLPTETMSAYAYAHMERTSSEFMLSAYGEPGGAAGIGPFAPDRYTTSRAGTIATCQDCHMRDVTGYAADSIYAVNRPGGSQQHPQSGLPLHDFTGSNPWVAWVLASALPGSPNYDPVNGQLLNQGADLLTLDLTQGLGIYARALLAGVERSRQQLAQAAAIEEIHYDPATGELSFRIQNQTGHKLISGYPEGRRMFVNVRSYAGGDLIHEINPYDAAAHTLKGLLASPNSPPLSNREIYEDALVYEMLSSSSLTGEEKSFHRILADGCFKDNRIPPKGFRNEEAAARLAEPCWQGAPAPDYFSAGEYAGGYDEIVLTLPTGADRIEIILYYQVISREYVEFLRHEINGTAVTLPGVGAGGDPAYLIQTDPFFAQLKRWGETIWQLWDHNKEIPGAAPLPMTRAVVEPAQESEQKLFLPLTQKSPTGE